MNAPAQGACSTVGVSGSGLADTVALGPRRGGNEGLGLRKDLLAKQEFCVRRGPMTASLHLAQAAADSSAYHLLGPSWLHHLRRREPMKAPARIRTAPRKAQTVGISAKAKKPITTAQRSAV